MGLRGVAALLLPALVLLGCVVDDRTADAQASQLMPVTVMVVVLMAVLSVVDCSVADVLCIIPP